MDIAFTSKNCTPPPGRTVGSGGRIFYMDEEPQGKLLARIALFRDGKQLACICICDQKFFFHEVADEIRAIISRSCNIPFANILLAATHTHSVPDLTPTVGIPAEDQLEFSFVAEFAELLVSAITEAQNSFIPLKHWQVGSAATAAWGICRRPIFSDGNGVEQVGTQGSRDLTNFIGLDGTDEQQLNVLSAYGDDEDILGGIVQYACHPTTQYGSKFYTADYPGVLYEQLDKEFPRCFLYANGPNGNVGNASGGAEFCQKMGKKLADKTMTILNNSKAVASGSLKVLSEKINISRRQPTVEQLAYAVDFLAKTPSESELAEFPRRMYGVKYHFHNNSLDISNGLCRQLLALQTAIEHGRDSEEVNIQAIAVSNEIVFIAISAEMFNQFRDRINKLSPFKHNCIITLANGWNGYIPPAESYNLGGYECCLSLINRLDTAAHDLIVRKTIEILNKLKTG